MQSRTQDILRCNEVAMTTTTARLRVITCNHDNHIHNSRKCNGTISLHPETLLIISTTSQALWHTLKNLIVWIWSSTGRLSEIIPFKIIQGWKGGEREDCKSALIFVEQVPTQHNNLGRGTLFRSVNEDDVFIVWLVSSENKQILFHNKRFPRFRLLIKTRRRSRLSLTEFIVGTDYL